MTFSPILNIGKSVSLAQKDKTPTITDEGLLFWWAHQDLNLGPKDSGLCSFHYSLDYAFII